jgi:DNA uptake protein ComE-like DNA-binding protein
LLKKILYQLNQSLGFSKTEAQGFIVVMLVSMFFLVLPFGYQQFSKPALPIINIQALNVRSIDDSVSNSIALNQKKPSLSRQLSPFHFNPNTISIDDLKSIGLSEIAIKNISNFRKKGYQYYTVKAFLKTYGIQDYQQKILEPYLHVFTQNITQSKSTDYKKTNTIISKNLSIDINNADTTDLIALKGIGSKLSIRIIKYREKLGGFVNKNQYTEIFGLDSTAIAALNEHTIISQEFFPRKINIQINLLDEWKKHPYLNYREALMIHNYLKAHPEANTFEHLKNIREINAEKLYKLKPYLE